MEYDDLGLPPQKLLSDASNNVRLNPLKHKFYPMFEHAFSIRDELVASTKAAASILQNHKIGPMAFDPSSAMADEAFKNHFDKIVDMFSEIIEKEPEDLSHSKMPPNPPYSNVISNFAPNSVVSDIGSGSGGALRNHDRNFTFECYEKEGVGPPVSEKGEPYDYKGEFLEPIDGVICHRNSMLHNENQQQFIDSDGLGIVPDLDYMLESGLCEQVGDEYRSVLGGIARVEYECKVPSVGMCRGYKAVATFKERLISVRLQGKFEIDKFERPEEMVLRQKRPVKPLQRHCFFTEKHDGMLVRLTGDGKNFFLTRKDRVCFQGVYDGPPFDLFAEEVRKNDEVYFILVRIDNYRGFGLFGFYNHPILLNYFVSRVKFDINGVGFRDNPEIDIFAPVIGEGVVYRFRTMHGYRECMVKKNITIDLKIQSIQTLVKYCETKGWILVPVHNVPSSDTGVHEFEFVNVFENNFALKHVRFRPDGVPNNIGQAHLEAFFKRIDLATFVTALEEM